MPRLHPSESYPDRKKLSKETKKDKLKEMDIKADDYQKQYD